MSSVLPRWRAFLVAPLVALLALFVLLGGFRTAFADICFPVYEVKSTADSGADTLRDGIDWVCEGGLITFNSSLNGSTITLASPLEIWWDMTIDGPGAELLAISSNGNGRIFNVASGKRVTIDGLTIKDGFSTSGDGGGISNAGILTVTHSVLTGNKAYNTPSMVGGAIYNAGTLVVIESVVISNEATSAGGTGAGIYNEGWATLIASEISSNEAGASGGGIGNFGQMLIIDSTISKNTFYDGNGRGIGIYNSGTITLTGSTISDHVTNDLGTQGAGIFNDGGKVMLSESILQGNRLTQSDTGNAFGGGLYNEEGEVNIEKSFIANNYVAEGGGAIRNDSGSLTIVNTTFYSNGSMSSGGGAILSFNSIPNKKVVVQNVTFVGNYGHPDEGQSILADGVFTINNSLFLTTTLSLPGANQCFGSSLRGMGNMGSDFSCLSFAPPPGLGIGVGPLGSYGGKVPVFPLLPGSLAMGFPMPPGSCPATDARGVARPQGSFCDIGAFESRGFNLVIEGGDNQAAAVNHQFDEPLRVGVSSAYSEPVDGGTLIFANVAAMMPITKPSINLPSASVTISGGKAAFTPTANSITGVYTVAALYGFGWPMLSFDLENTLPVPAVELESASNPATFGESMTFTATVSGFSASGIGVMGSPAITGSVRFLVDGEERATFALEEGKAVYSSGQWDAGEYTITAVYSGNVIYAGSTSNVVTQVINKDTTSVVVTSNLNPIEVENSLTLTATVSTGLGIQALGGEIEVQKGSILEGTVEFYEGANLLGSDEVDDNGVATYSSPVPAAGEGAVTAVFVENDNYLGSTSEVYTLTVYKHASATELEFSTNVVTVGDPFAYTVTVDSPYLAGSVGVQTLTDPMQGKLSLYQNGLYATDVSVGAMTPFVAAGNAQAPAGTYTISAIYLGNELYASSDSNVATLQVNKANSSVSVESSVNPSTYGTSVTFTATVSANIAPLSLGAGSIGVQSDFNPLSGEVTFKDGLQTIDSVSVDENGVAVLTTASFALGSGEYNITAEYSGNEYLNDSVSSNLPHVVNKAETSTTLESNLNPSAAGEEVIFTAQVSSDVLADSLSIEGASKGNPLAGDVIFKKGEETLGSVTLDDSGVATLTTSSLAVGSHTITAEYEGSDNFDSSTSSSVTQVVNELASSTTLISSKNPATVGESVTFTAQVSSLGIDAATINPLHGDVTFRNGKESLGTVTLNEEGVAILTTSALAVGSRTITAKYNGNEQFGSSVSNSLTQVVNEQPQEPQEPTAPLAVNDAAGTLEGNAVNVAVLGNDVAGSNSSLSIQSVSQPSNGSAVIDGNNVVYTPAAGFSGLDSFTYTIVDGNSLTDSGTVAIVVSKQASSGQAPQVSIIDNSTGGNKEFSGNQAEIALQVPSGVYTGTLTEKDVFYLALTWITTPVQGNSGNLKFGNVSFDLSAYLNGNKLEHFVFGEPVTMTINYGEGVLGELSPESVQLLFLDGENWSNSGIEVVSHDTVNRTFVVLLSHLSEFALFGSSPTGLEEVDQPGNMRLFMPQVGR